MRRHQAERDRLLWATPLRRSMLMLVLILVIFTVEVHAQGSPAYAEAQKAYAMKQFKVAAQLFRKAAVDERGLPPEAHTDALFMQARCLANLGEFVAAETATQAYLKQEKNSYRALYLLAYILERENKPKDSLEMFTRAAAISAPRPEDLRLVALDYILLDDYTDAIHWFNRAVEGDASNVEAWYDLGRAQMHVGNFTEAERDFELVLAIEPHAAKALNNLALSYDAQNRFDEALAAYGRAIEAQKDSPHPSEQPLLNAGALLNTMNRFGEALPLLQKATALAPSSSRCHEELSRAYTGTRHDDLARKQMERAVSLEPKSPSLHYQLSEIYRRVGLASRSQTELKISSELYGTRSATMEEGQRSGSTPAVTRRSQ